MPLNEAFIRSIANTKSFARGQSYYHADMVLDLEKRGDHLMASVQGSEDEPYHIKVVLKKGEFVSAVCSCPYDFEGCCKHVVAVLLAYLQDAANVVEKPSVQTLLADLSHEQLVNLLTGLLDHHPTLIRWVEQRLAVPTPHGQPTQQTIDSTYIKKQADKMFVRAKGERPDYDDYDYYNRVSHDIEDWLSQVTPFLEVGEGQNALIMLEAIMKPYLKLVSDYDAEGEASDIVELMTDQVTEAILLANLTPDERRQWHTKIKLWQKESHDLDDYWELPLLAVRQGDDATLSVGAKAEHAHELNVIRLRVLARQGKTEEYLRLAEAEGHVAAYLTMLVQVGRIAEAMAYPNLSNGNEALSLAQALEEQNLRAEALQVAEQGLSLPDHYQLAKWLQSIAPEALALRAATLAFQESFNLTDYRALKTLAGTSWADMKDNLMNDLATSKSYQKVEIYMAEGLINEAIELVKSSSHVNFDILRKLVELAYTVQPNWVIEICRQEAESIMDKSDSANYPRAANWLKWAKAAYQHSQREAAWHVYLDNLLTKHARKYALKPLLEKLR